MRKLANAELNRISKEAFAKAKKTPLIINPNLKKFGMDPDRMQAYYGAGCRHTTDPGPGRT